MSQGGSGIYNFFRVHFCGLENTNCKALKVELLLNYMKKFRRKSFKTQFFYSNLARSQEFKIIYLDFYGDIFIHPNTENLILSPRFSSNKKHIYLRK